MLRRSRGYVPASIDLPFAAPRPLLACGGQLKATFCLARGRRAWVSHHIGDLEHYPALVAYRQGIEHFERLFALQPELIAYDLHPGYSSTAYALERDGLELTGVQHHHAHLAAASPSTAWRSGRRRDLRRVGVRDGRHDLGRGGARRRSHRIRALRGAPPVRMPGGAAAIHEPWRMACSWLASACGGSPALPDALAGEVDTARWRQVSGIVERGGLAGDDEHGPSLRRGRGVVRGARPRVVRRSSCS